MGALSPSKCFYVVTTSLTYDAMGNPTAIGTKFLSWRGKQLAGFTDGSTAISYTYDQNGLRLQKTVNGTVTDYYYNGTVLISQTTGADTLLFSYDANGKAVSLRHLHTNGNTVTTNDYYYLRNAQSDIIAILNASGTKVVEYTYDSWGRLLTCTGTHASTLGTLNPLRYRGYVYDTETKWYYLQSRYYDPSLCRFISADVYLSTGQGVLGCNAYCYCGNNPANHTDNGGHFWDTVFDVISLGASIVEVCTNPTDPWAWAGLAGDVIDLIPFVTGVGEATRGIKTTVKIVDVSDNVSDVAKVVYKAADKTSDIRKATGSYEILF